MHNEVFADSIGEIAVTGTIVRIDLVSMSPTHKDAAGQPVPELRQRVIMSLEGFANSFDVIQKAMNGLIEAGAIRKVGEAGTVPNGANGHGAPHTNGSGQRHSSPNFA